eukprot:SAG31_NODE_26271_length_445_cov_1.037572_1_plen_37_part_10
MHFWLVLDAAWRRDYRAAPLRHQVLRLNANLSATITK